MQSSSANLRLPYIQANQAQKHVTHNEGMRVLDAVTQLSVLSNGASNAPTEPQAGDRHIVGVDAQGDWAGQDGTIALWADTGWTFVTPQAGWSAWDHANGTRMVFDGTTWTAEITDPVTLDVLGINATATQTDRLIVQSDATLFSHDTSGDHRTKINKATASDTASQLFQTNWTGHAEIGLTGSDDFALKVSPNGTDFHTAFHVDRTNGHVHFHNGTSGMTNPEFGTGRILTTDYSSAKGSDLFVNGTGLLGNAYNFPNQFDFDALTTPNLPGSFAYQGYFTQMLEMDEFLPITPQKVYKISTYIRQASVPGDWSTYTNAERHRQYMGLQCYDVDKLRIEPKHHMRFKAGGTDSLTTLTNPLSPGDTIVHLNDCSGWNTSNGATYNRGIIIFGYKNSQGGAYDGYSRIVEFNLFDTAGVDTVNNTITLKAPFPATMGNPDDPNGTWPVGVSLANSSAGGSKYAILSGQTLPDVDTWYDATGYMGGIDTSGSNYAINFTPGTAYAKVFWLLNYSNRSGGFSTYPDTGPDHTVWIAGISITQDTTAVTHKAPDGRVFHKTLHADYTAGTLQLAPTGRTLVALP